MSERPHATHPKDAAFFQGVLAALSVLKNCRSVASARLAIARTVGAADLMKRAELDGTVAWAGLDKIPGLAKAALARGRQTAGRAAPRTPSPRQPQRRRARENSGAGKPETG